jgi:hypothetical protein
MCETEIWKFAVASEAGGNLGRAWPGVDDAVILSDISLCSHEIGEIMRNDNIK